MTTATADAPSKLVEFTTCQGASLRIDREAGVIRGVKILGAKSANGRTYTTEAMLKAVDLYEKAKVNVNHPAGRADSPRDYRDRLGHLESVQAHADGLYGDLHFNPKHPLAEQLLWDAENAPAHVGMSHNVTAVVGRKDGKAVVEEITKVVSVDLVAEPATTRGLFESDSNPETLEEVSAVDYSQLTVNDIKANRVDLLEAIGSQAVAEQAEAIGKAALAEQAESEEAKAQAAKLLALTEEVDGLKAEKTAIERRSTRDALLAEAKIPEDLVTEVFRGLIHNAADDAAVKSLIEDRQAIAKGIPAKTKSKEQETGLTEGEGSGVKDAKDFASRLKG